MGMNVARNVKTGHTRKVLGTLKYIALFLSAFLFVFLYIFQLGVVSGDSMQPTLATGDMLLMRRIGYEPKRGDIVLVKVNGRTLVKRIIAIEGDTISINPLAGCVYLNDEELEEPYILEPTYFAGDAFDEITVDEGCYFIMGDNRNISLDSRCKEVGQIKRSQISSGFLAKIPTSH